METRSLTEAVRARARELGFDRVGIAPAAVSSRAEQFRFWLAKGYHGEMGYLARHAEVRVDARQRGGWGRSIVSAGINYLPERADWSAAPGVLGRIARYAAGEDYHRIVEERLTRLLRFVESERPGVRGRIAVDTSALLERDIAEAAGVGWSAKNTLVIDREVGSWLLLGELILDCELDYDAPLEDQCGTCRACLDACPTGAILEERMVDARRCISYLTIELRGAIPPEARAQVGGHLFGCDICQEVCPWNDRVPASREPAFRARPAWEGTRLEDLVRLEEPAFQALTARSAVRRAGRRGLVRNALVVAANTGDEPALRAARERLEDADPVVRGTAAWAVGRAGVGGRDALERALARETDPVVRREVEAALERGSGDAGNPETGRGRGAGQGSTGTSTSKDAPETRTG